MTRASPRSRQSGSTGSPLVRPSFFTRPRVWKATSRARAASALAICRTYTVMPPASPTRGSTTGLECTTSMETRRSGRCGTAATDASRTARVPLPGEISDWDPCYPRRVTSQGPNKLRAGALGTIGTGDLHRVEGEALRPQVELVALGAPEEIEALQALLDAAADEQHHDHDPRRQGAGAGVEGRVVEGEGPRVGERERRRDPLGPHLEEVEREEAERLEGAGDPFEETGTLEAHEPALLTHAGAVHGEEVLQVGLEGLLGGGG